jgi:hypothetical protein
MDSIMAQAFPSLMSVIETEESAETKLPVHEEFDVSARDAGT